MSTWVVPEELSRLLRLEALSGAEERTNALTVSEFNKLFRDVVRATPELKSLNIVGEVSNYTHHSSGHHYFSLRDKDSTLRCAMFRQRSTGARFLEDGAQVIALGNAEYYPPHGSFQLIVTKVEDAGVGAEQVRLAQLRKKLESEGLFDASRKRRPPSYPKVVAVVTSPTGSVREDITTTFARRWPLLSMTIVAAKVQGDGAVESVVEGIKASENCGANLCIVARGGGSFEDLKAFNSEEVARAIFASKIPVISAIGHETDTTIADEVADLRAPTPTAAAELASPDREELLRVVELLSIRASTTVKNRLDYLEPDLQRIQDRLRDSEPFSLKQRTIATLEQRLSSSGSLFLQSTEDKLDGLGGKLNSLSPFATLKRGYALVFKNERPVYLEKHFKVGDKVDVHTADTRLKATINTVEIKRD